MNCEEIKENLELYALGVLERADAAEIHDHLTGGCDVCTKNLGTALNLNALVLSTTAEEEPSALLRSRVLNSVRSAPAARSVKPPVVWITIAASLAAGMVWIGLDDQKRRN